MASQEETSRRRRVTFQQLEALWEFLNAHKDISVGYNKSAQAREYSRRMWVSVSEALNSQGEGATKDWKGWSNYWVDYKAKLKKRAAALRTSQRRTGGGPSDVAPLSEIEKKFLSLLGDGFGIGLPNTQVDPFPVLPQFSADMDIEPEAGTSSNLIAETVTNIERQGFELVVDEEAQSQPAHPTTALPEHEVVVPSGSTILQGAQNVGARRNRQPILSQDAARRIMVDIAKSRLELEQKNNQALQEMLQTQKQSLLVWQEISQTLSRLEAKIDRTTRGPETRNEGASDG